MSDDMATPRFYPSLHGPIPVRESSAVCKRRPPLQRYIASTSLLRCATQRVPTRAGRMSCASALRVRVTCAEMLSPALARIPHEPNRRRMMAVGVERAAAQRDSCVPRACVPRSARAVRESTDRTPRAIVITAEQALLAWSCHRHVHAQQCCAPKAVRQVVVGSGRQVVGAA